MDEKFKEFYSDVKKSMAGIIAIPLTGAVFAGVYSNNLNQSLDNILVSTGVATMIGTCMSLRHFRKISEKYIPEITNKKYHGLIGALMGASVVPILDQLGVKGLDGNFYAHCLPMLASAGFILGEGQEMLDSSNNYISELKSKGKK